ncbi:hypothetical protein ASG90_12545 [Nocardioides sp. Soil797]|nr:hypothetical protein ASG90_12545 [Nocardioides sp. Soil797]
MPEAAFALWRRSRNVALADPVLRGGALAGIGRTRHSGRMTPLHALATASYAAIGAVALAQPGRIPELFGGTAPTADSRNEIRAVYGGLTLAMAGIGVKSPMVIGALSLGMATGRAASVVVEPESTMLTKAFVGMEVGLAAAYVLAARSVRRTARND